MQDEDEQTAVAETARRGMTVSLGVVLRALGWFGGIGAVVAVERGSLWWTVAGALFLATMKAYSDRGRLREAKKLRRAEDQLAHLNNELKTSFGSGVEPVLRLLNRLHEEPSKRERERLRGQAIQRAVEAAARLAGPPRTTRASFFRYEKDSGEFEPMAWHGRFDAPSTVFRPDTPNGAHVAYLCETRQSALCLNTERPQDGTPIISGKPYKTYIAVPVLAESRVVGLLTVDSTRPGDLDRRHKAIAAAFGQMLALIASVKVTPES